MLINTEHIEFSGIKKELGFQKNERVNVPSNLIVSNKKFVAQNKKKEKTAREIIIYYNQIKKQRESLDEQIEGLKIMIFMTSHRVRQPIAHILGISNLVGHHKNSPEELNKLMGYLKESAQSLETFTIELIDYMVSMEEKLNKTGCKEE